MLTAQYSVLWCLLVWSPGGAGLQCCLVTCVRSLFCRRHPCTVTEVFNFCWVLFVHAKGKHFLFNDVREVRHSAPGANHSSSQTGGGFSSPLSLTCVVFLCIIVGSCRNGIINNQNCEASISSQQPLSWNARSRRAAHFLLSALVLLMHANESGLHLDDVSASSFRELPHDQRRPGELVPPAAVRPRPRLHQRPAVQRQEGPAEPRVQRWRPEADVHIVPASVNRRIVSHSV